jgi:thioredoxin 1
MRSDPHNDDGPERRAEIRATDDRVWDMVGNLLHPTAIYVLLQLVIWDHLSTASLFREHGPLSPMMLAIYAAQFLGAWAVFYTTLLRDMGKPSRGGTVLLLAAVATVLAQVLLPPAEELPQWALLGMGGLQFLLAVIVFLLTWLRWRREKRAFEQSTPVGTWLVPLAMLPQQARGAGEAASAATDDFFVWLIWILVLVPSAIVALLALKKRKAQPELPHTSDFSWQADVVQSGLPVIIHAYHAWSVGDRVIEAQVLKLAATLRGRARVFWLDLDRNPVTVGQFATLEEKSVALFIDGKLRWQCQGVHDDQTILAEIARFLPPAT